MTADVDRAKERGYAEARGEWHENVYGLAVPVFAINGYALAAIGAVTTAAELNSDPAATLVPPMLAASGKISAYLGYHAPQLSVLA